MMKMFNKILLIVLATFSFMSIYGNIFAWEGNPTHKDITGHAADNSIISKGNGDYLKNIGFSNALDERFTWKKFLSIKEWLQEGAALEDKWWGDEGLGFRCRNHFHNPLKNKDGGPWGEWDSAGLDDFFSGIPALRWAQNRTKQSAYPEGDWTWQEARDRYYRALTSQTDAERQENFARTFRALGHQLHLVQDMAVPAHVRNDAHPLRFNKAGGLHIEKWAAKKENRQTVNSYATSPESPSIDLNKDITYRGEILVPITQFTDIDKYNGSNPSTSLSIGLAEYTNANFFSDDTIFAAEIYQPGHRHYFPNPKKSDTNVQSLINHELIPETNTLTGDTEFHISRVDDKGHSIINYFVQPTYHTNDMAESGAYYRSFYLSENCHNDYSEHLIPRAVGYSAGLIDYFFRGELDVKKVKEGFEITNTSKEIMKNGHFELYYDGNDGVRQAIHITSGAEVPENNPINPDGSQTIMFTEPDDVTSYVIVYRGGLGNEINSVVGKVKPGNAFYLTLERSDGLVLKDGVVIQVYNSKKEKLDVEAAYNNDKKRWEIDLGQNEDSDGFYLAYDCDGGIRTEYKGAIAPVEPHFIGEAISPSTIQLVDVIKYWPITLTFTLPGKLSSWDSISDIVIWQQSKSGELIEVHGAYQTGIDTWRVNFNLGDPDWYNRVEYNDFYFKMVFQAILAPGVLGESPETLFGTVRPGEIYEIPIPYILPDPEDTFYKPEWEYIGWEDNVEFRNISVGVSYGDISNPAFEPGPPTNLPDIIETPYYYIFTRPNHDYRFRIDDLSYKIVAPEDQGKTPIPVKYNLSLADDLRPEYIITTRKVDGTGKSHHFINWHEESSLVAMYAVYNPHKYEEPSGQMTGGWDWFTVDDYHRCVIGMASDPKYLFTSKVPAPELAEMPHYWIQNDDPRVDYSGPTGNGVYLYNTYHTVTVSSNEWLYNLPDFGDGNIFRVVKGDDPICGLQTSLRVYRHISTIEALLGEGGEPSQGTVEYVAVEGDQFAIYPAGNQKLTFVVSHPSNDFPITVRQSYLTTGGYFEEGSDYPDVVPGGYGTPFYFNFKYILNHPTFQRYIITRENRSVRGWKVYPPLDNIHFVGICIRKERMFPTVQVWKNPKTYWRVQPETSYL